MVVGHDFNNYDENVVLFNCYDSKTLVLDYDGSSQNAYQALVAYDASVRLCLNSWARGCAEAPEFLRDECLLLRNAFGYVNDEFQAFFSSYFTGIVKCIVDYSF